MPKIDICGQRKKLTRNQCVVLNFIKQYIHDNQYPPSMLDMNKHFGWASPNAAVGHLNALERRGHIKRTRNVARGIKVL